MLGTFGLFIIVIAIISFPYKICNNPFAMIQTSNHQVTVVHKPITIFIFRLDPFRQWRNVINDHIRLYGPLYAHIITCSGKRIFDTKFSKILIERYHRFRITSISKILIMTLFSMLMFYDVNV